MATVTAVVVTYNRKDLLSECLTSLLHQTTPVEKILVVNNASTDGTEALFQKGGLFDTPVVELMTLSENLGGAGGFHAGMKAEAFSGTDFLWIMDDDTIPEETALAALLEADSYLKTRNVTASFLASSVFGPQGEPMNVPVLQKKPTDNGYADWYRYLNKGLVNIKSATFVSLLIPVKAVQQVGLPEPDYFIWGDDTEYTQRLVTLYGPAFLCGGSKVCHKRQNVKNMNLLTEDNPERVAQYYFFFRNSLRNAKKYNGPLNTLGHICEYELTALRVLLDRKVTLKREKVITIQKGILAFLF